jgi:hypothetical protein
MGICYNIRNNVGTYVTIAAQLTLMLTGLILSIIGYHINQKTMLSIGILCITFGFMWTLCYSTIKLCFPEYLLRPNWDILDELTGNANFHEGYVDSSKNSHQNQEN